mmetsp:Transcript_21428/g.59581  ORF Transcript_21428/g.59581 Transcript_21428/m.59581 type:complete len:204 (+) Transcript_21428:490-1101(+)
MVGFRRPKGPCGLHFQHHRSLTFDSIGSVVVVVVDADVVVVVVSIPRIRRELGSNRSQGGIPLLGRVHVHPRPVVVPNIPSHAPIPIRRVVDAPIQKDRRQIRIGHHGGIEIHHHRLAVARVARADLLVVRPCLRKVVSLRVSHQRVLDAGDALEGELESPEAPPRERGQFEAGQRWRPRRKQCDEQRVIVVFVVVVVVVAFR